MLFSDKTIFSTRLFCLFAGSVKTYYKGLIYLCSAKAYQVLTVSRNTSQKSTFYLIRAANVKKSVKLNLILFSQSGISKKLKFWQFLTLSVINRSEMPNLIYNLAHVLAAATEDTGH